MAEQQVTKYRLTVHHTVTLGAIRFRPGATYTVKAAIYDALMEAAPGAVSTAQPIEAGGANDQV